MVIVRKTSTCNWVGLFIGTGFLRVILRSLRGKYLVAVLDDELNGIVFGMHVAHLPFQTVVSHDSGCKNDSNILGGHLSTVRYNFNSRNGWEAYQVLTLSHGHSDQMEYQELKTIAVLGR